MKVGDKIFCNKDYLIDSEILFKKNKYYEIIDVYYVSDYKEHFGGFFTKDTITLFLQCGLVYNPKMIIYIEIFP